MAVATTQRGTRTVIGPIPILIFILADVQLRDFAQHPVDDFPHQYERPKSYPDSYADKEMVDWKNEIDCPYHVP